MKPHWLILTVCLLGLSVLGGSILLAQGNGTHQNYLPAVYRAEPSPTPTVTPTPSPTATGTPILATATPPPGAMTEFRGVWLTRFDWTSATNVGTAVRLNEMVDNIAYAGFNAIFFQVRGTGDAFYTPGLEPWSARLNSNGQLGQDPGWDPLQTMINRAQQHGIQVHAYINVYPLWDCASIPPSDTVPQHLYYKVANEYGYSDGRLVGAQWDTSYKVDCSSYLRTSPASGFVDDHLLAVGKDLVTRYQVDGLHLDYIRYGGRNASCDPVSESVFGGPCFSGGDGVYADWQRAQVNGTVWKFYQEVVPLKPGVLLSAAVWPQYIDYWNWGGTEGYHDFYQDSKAWLAGGYIDAISPMIYGSSFWSQEKWRILTADFQASANGRFVYAGIGADYENFSEISNRIAMGRELGIPGHAIFSYGALAKWGYFDDLRNG
ncbi:MAG: family 10 glycosylhydrolase, partial [Anaerolineales bacterium]|nr:family 10 glycosylhydrolase [Anaerolineales bacterium]